MRITTLGLAAAAALLLSTFAVSVPTYADDEEKKVKFSGDFRGRIEKFSFSKDETGSDRPSRSRLRYRFRVNMKATINDHFRAAARLTTNPEDNRSGNQTIGSPDDFFPNEFALRRAYLTYLPFSGGDLGGGPDGSWSFDFGRVPNPFIWKSCVDKMVWDGDIALAGASTQFDIMASETFKLFANTGWYAVDENSTAKDPYLAPFQAGVEIEPNDSVEFGARGTYYYYDRLDTNFVKRSTENGNTEDGLTGDPMGGSLSIVEGHGYVKFAGNETWPITAFGGVAVNTSAAVSAAAPDAGKADTAYNLGLDIGNKKKAVRLGVTYVYFEANSLVSQFTDSDYLDGVTNRKGVIGWVQRTLLKNTDGAFTLFWSDGIEPAFSDSNKNSERVRLIFDLSVKF